MERRSSNNTRITTRSGAIRRFILAASLFISVFRSSCPSFTPCFRHSLLVSVFCSSFLSFAHHFRLSLIISTVRSSLVNYIHFSSCDPPNNPSPYHLPSALAMCNSLLQASNTRLGYSRSHHSTYIHHQTKNYLSPRVPLF